MTIIEKGQLDGDFNGFKDTNTVFTFFLSGSSWKQNEYKYSYHYSFMPNAKVVMKNGRYLLSVEGMNDEVEVVRNNYELSEYSKKLFDDLEKAKENPTLKALENLEKDRKSILENLSQYDTNILDEKLKKLQLEINNPLIQSALKDTTFADSISKSAKLHDLAKLQDSLGFDYKKYLQPEISATQKALDSIKETINNPTLQHTMFDTPKLDSYESEIEKITKSIANNQNLFESSKDLTTLGKQIANDSLKYKMEEQSKFTVPKISHREIKPREIPENPLPKQNAQIINILEAIKEQNDILIKFEKSDQEIQNNNIALMNQLQTNNEIMIEELKEQNLNNEQQLKELRKHNDNLEEQLSQNKEQIDDNKDANSVTRKVAIWSIGISIVVGIIGFGVSFYISNIEMEDNDKDNEKTHKILKSINNKSIQNESMSILIKEIQLQNKFNKSIEKNQINLIKVIEKQNDYLKLLFNKKDENKTKR